MATVAESWDRIHKWLESNAPQMLNLLRPGASEEQLKQLEEKLQVNDLPEDFKDCYRIHDGCSADYFFGAPNNSMAFAPIEDIMRDWAIHKTLYDEQDPSEFKGQYEVPLEIQNDWWLPRWIPIGCNGCGDYLQLDLAPTEAGTFGQVIQWYHEGDPYELLAPTYADYLKKFADDLEGGMYVVTHDDGINLIHKDYED